MCIRDRHRSGEVGCVEVGETIFHSEEPDSFFEAEQFDAQDQALDGVIDHVGMNEENFSAPWAVRFGGFVYLQMKIVNDMIQRVEVESLGDSDGQIVVDRVIFSRESNDFQSGLYKIGSRGIGLRIRLVVSAGGFYEFATLHYSSESDFCTLL